MPAQTATTAYAFAHHVFSLVGLGDGTTEHLSLWLFLREGWGVCMIVCVYCMYPTIGGILGNDVSDNKG
jgi:hypothetical protein